MGHKSNQEKKGQDNGNPNSRFQGPFFVMGLVEFFILCVRINHKTYKSQGKTDSEYYLTFGKHIFLFLTKVAKKQIS